MSKVTLSQVQRVLDKVKTALKRKGSKTIAGLAKIFRSFDSFDGDNKVDSSEFFVGLKGIGVELTRTESDTLLSFFDKDEDGCIDLDEFLVGIRGQLNERRKDIVLKAFYKFDKNCSGKISTSELY